MNWTVLFKSAWRWLWPVLKREGVEIAVDAAKAAAQKTRPAAPPDAP